MGKYIKGDDGKFKGSVGDGRDNTPTLAGDIYRPGGNELLADAQESLTDIVDRLKTPRLREVNRDRRGHDFYPQRPMPEMYSTEDVPEGDQVVHEHYFIGGCDWYITEWNPSDGSAYGWCDLGHGGEWGYVNLVELEGVLARDMFPVERDCYWQPTRFSDIATRPYGH